MRSQRVSTHFIQKLSGILLFIALGGCAGNLLKKGVGDSALPEDLPKEMHDKFEVREEGAAPRPDAAQGSPLPTGFVVDQPKASVSPTLLDRKAKRTKKKKGKYAVPDLSAPLLAKDGEQAAADAPQSYPNRRPSRDPLWVGEKQVWDITYFGMSAGEFTLSTLPHKVINNRKVYHFHGDAVSSKVFSMFYRVDDKIDSFMDYLGLFSHRFHVVINESKQTRDALELNDSEKGQTFYWNRWTHVDRGTTETKGFFPAPKFAQDSLSALFFVRGRNELRDGDVITFPVISEGNYWEAVITVLRRQMMDSPLGKVQTVVLKPEHKLQGVLQKTGDSFIWLTDDDRRYVVRLEAKVKIGTVVGTLKSVVPGVSP